MSRFKLRSFQGRVMTPFSTISIEFGIDND
jgi:hypothetical protein